MQISSKTEQEVTHMIGAIIGDIVGSRFEFDNYRKKDFQLFHKDCFATDDSIMTLAIADAIMECKSNFSHLGEQAVKSMRTIGQPYPDCGYGGKFAQWMYGVIDGPYNSFGNGAAMRVSACGWAADSIEEAKVLSKAVTEVTHNHPEGLKGAEAIATSVYILGRKRKHKKAVRDWISDNYYDLDFTIDQIRPTYKFNETCQETVPQAIEAFLESTDFEDAIRIAVSLGGDSDTVAAITGSLAEAYYGVPNALRVEAETFLDERLKAILERFEAKYGRR